MKATIQRIAGKSILAIEPEDRDDLEAIRGIDEDRLFRVISKEAWSNGNVVSGGVILLEAEEAE